jgi:hypothetical protein
MTIKDEMERLQMEAYCKVLTERVWMVVVVVCPCRSNAQHRGLLSEVSMVMCVDVVSDQPTDRTSSTQS